MCNPSRCSPPCILHDLFHRPPIPLHLATLLHHLGNLSSQHKFIHHLVDNFLFASPVFSPAPLFTPSARCVWRSLTSCHQPCPGYADSHFSAHLRCVACPSCVHRESSVHHCLLLTLWLFTTPRTPGTSNTTAWYCATAWPLARGRCSRASTIRHFTTTCFYCSVSVFGTLPQCVVR